MFLYSLLPHLLFSMHVYELQHILFSTHGFELEFCLSFYSNGKRDVLTSNEQKIFWTVLFESGTAEFFSMFHFSVTVVFILRLQPFWHLCSNVCAVCFNRGCEQTQTEVSAFWRGKENFVHKRFFIKYRQINIFKVKNTILYENCILWAPTAYEKYCCHPLKIEKFVPNGKPLKYWHSRVGKCH